MIWLKAETARPLWSRGFCKAAANPFTSSSVTGNSQAARAATLRAIGSELVVPAMVTIADQKEARPLPLVLQRPCNANAKAGASIRPRSELLASSAAVLEISPGSR
jgi:hypothetical protein